MHTDEAVNAFVLGQLLAGKPFQYDPQDRHGPALAAETLPAVRWLGVKQFADLTESQLRRVPAVTGAVMVLLFGAGVEMFGFTACLVAALLFAFAPLPVYYSRYFIHETLFVAVTLGLILSGGRALKAKGVGSAALAGFCAALLLACKETALIHFGALVVALLFVRFGPAGRAAARPEGSLKNAGQEPGAAIKKILTASAVFGVALTLLFTWFGQNRAVFLDLVRAVSHVAARAAGQGHEKPCWYYAALLGGGGAGAAMLGLAALGFFRALTSARHFGLLVYALLVAGIYSAIPYKTPWLALNLWLPLSLLAGLAVQWLWVARPRGSARVGVLACLGVCGFFMTSDLRQRVFLTPSDETNPYAYAHTGGDLLRLAPRLQELARQTNMASPRIAVVATDAWPLPWYLRTFSQTGFWQPGQDPGPADFFITAAEVPAGLADRLKEFRPEFFGVRPEVVLILWVPRMKEVAPEP